MKSFQKNNLTERGLRAALRAGKCTWPGGHPYYFIASDGATLSFEAVCDNLHGVVEAMKRKIDNGWRVVAVVVNYGNPELYCAHTNERIESPETLESTK